MKIETLKASIEANNISDSLIVFHYEDVPFVAVQYVKEISRIRNLKVSYIEDITALEKSSEDIFGTSQTSSDITVYKCDTFESISENLARQKDLIIVARKISAAAKKLFQPYIVEIPKLKEWQIKDYVYSSVPGIDSKELDWFIQTCHFDIYRIENELDKLKLFSENERKFLFSDMKYQGAFSDLSVYNVFNITNAVTSKDINNLINALKEIKSFDAEPLGIVTLLYQGFRKLIQVWLAKNPTPDNTGLKSNVIYALNKAPRVYSKEQLLNCFLMLTEIDKQLKSGKIEINWIIDYVICKCLCF